MKRAKDVVRHWRGVLAGSALAGLLVVGCTGATGDVAQSTLQEASATAAAEDHEHHTDDAVVSNALTVNVELTDAGIKPANIFIPLGQSMRLLVRNRGASEHHYEVLGLIPANLRWIGREETQAEIDLVMSGAVAADDHSAHHDEASVVPYRGASPAGIQPTGNEVHAYADPGEVDTVLFTATNAGTFRVVCPLHPEMAADVTVF